VFRQERHKSAPRPQPVAKTLMHVCGYVAVWLCGSVAAWLCGWLSGWLAVWLWWSICSIACAHTCRQMSACVWTCEGPTRGHAGRRADMRGVTQAYVWTCVSHQPRAQQRSHTSTQPHLDNHGNSRANTRATAHTHTHGCVAVWLGGCVAV
jgi:hypothetical protein